MVEPEQGNMVDVVVVHEQQEYYVQATIEPNVGINIDLLQCQILSLVGLLPDEQILVTSRGEIIASPISNASMALSSLPLSTPWQRERVFVIKATTVNENVAPDWREICTRCTFGDRSVVQPAFRRLGEGDSDALVCAACATTCGTDAAMVSPLDWRSSKTLAQRFVSELLVIAGEPDVPTPPGFEKVPGDLNYSASGNFVHLFIKRGGTRVVTQVTVTHEQLGDKVPRESSQTKVHLPIDCNSGSASNTAVFIGYDLVSTSHRESMNTYAITEIRLVVGDSDIPEGFIKISKNLNQGCLRSEAIYLVYKLAPLGGFACTVAHGAFGECLFQSRHSVNVPASAVIAAGCSPESDTVLANLESARQRADNAMLENHYKQHEPAMRSRLEGGIDRVKTYENPRVQAEALKRIPVETLHERARANSTPLPSYRDELVMQLTHWFKREFFTWMNQPKCAVCSFEKTQLVRTDPPSTPEEIAGQAGRVEVYQCSQCRGFTRFPRYNDPVKLLDTRTGRCGEWANCFTLCCRAMGFEARYVLDVTDHVWTEVYSDHHKRWLHCDSCEDQLDRPLTYEVGWGKKLSYIFSFSHEEVVDTAQRYTQNWDDMLLRRSEVSEPWLASTIQRLNQNIRQTLSPDRIRVLDERAVNECAELMQGRKATAEEVQGRVSGSDEWKSQRKEDGKGTENEGAVNPHPVQHLRHGNKAQPPVTELLQMLMKTALIGCHRGDDCKNPWCVHTRSRVAPHLSPTDRAAQALQEVAAIQAKSFSPEGLASFLCQPTGSIQDFVLAQHVSVYLPLQDGETNGSSNTLVDVSGNGHHALSTAPLRKPFKIPASHGKEELAAGLQLLPGRQLSVPMPTAARIVVSWLARFDLPSFEFSNEGTAFSIMSKTDDESEGFAVRVCGGADKDVLVVEATTKDVAVKSSTIIKFGLYYHFSVVIDQAAGYVAVLTNAKEVLRLQTEISAQRSSSLMFQSPLELNKSSPAVAVISHLAVFSDMNEESFQKFNEVMKQRFVCWPPLQAFDTSGIRTDKTCTQPEATLQSGYRVCRVRMWGSEFFDGIQFVYQKSGEDGTVSVEGPVVGNHVAHDSIRSPTVDFALLPNEYLVRLSGRKGAWTDCIRLETNFGRRILCGGSGGGEFSIDLASNPHPVQIRAVHFDVGDHLVDAVAFVAEAPVANDDKSRDELQRILETIDSVKQKGVICAATRYLENIVASPDDLKFQRIRASNKFFTSNVGALEVTNQKAFMKWCGFEDAVEGGETFYVYQPSTLTDVPKSAWAAVRLHYLKAFSVKK